MYKVSLVLLCLTIWCCQVEAQVFPKEGSELYYRIIGFSVPALPSVISYRFEIAAGSYANDQDFEKKIKINTLSKQHKVIAEVPSFGSRYTWRVSYIAKNGILSKSMLFHFSTRTSPDVDNAVTRLRVTKPAERYKDNYVFIDEASVLYDMKGKPIWFLPGKKKQDNPNKLPRDIKITPAGTITYLQECQPYEIDYNGNYLWHYDGHETNAPLDTFHHEFTRLTNGHYMGMMLDNVILKQNFAKDNAFRKDSTDHYQKIGFSNLVELDEKGHIVWRWNGLDYVTHSDLSFMKNSDLPILDLDFHQNAFYFDEKNNYIYLSFRDIWRVIKIKYPEGNLVNTYGPIYSANDSVLQGGPFCYQHSCKLSREGYLYLFNNNHCGAGNVPTVMMLRETVPGGNGLKKVWEYQCTIEDPVIAHENPGFLSGGNVQEMPDGPLFVSMGAPYSKVFIVARDKRVLWSAMPERYNVEYGKWGLPIGVYRASIITREDLEKLIWNSERE